MRSASRATAKMIRPPSSMSRVFAAMLNGDADLVEHELALPTTSRVSATGAKTRSGSK
jgi:hypothetical protein